MHQHKFSQPLHRKSSCMQFNCAFELQVPSLTSSFAAALVRSRVACFQIHCTKAVWICFRESSSAGSKRGKYFYLGDFQYAHFDIDCSTSSMQEQALNSQLHFPQSLPTNLTRESQFAILAIERYNEQKCITSIIVVQTARIQE